MARGGEKSGVYGNKKKWKDEKNKIKKEEGKICIPRKTCKLWRIGRAIQMYYGLL